VDVSPRSRYKYLLSLPERVIRSLGALSGGLLTKLESMIRSVLAMVAGIAALTVTSFAIEALADPLLMRMFPQALPTRAAVGQNLVALVLTIPCAWGACRCRQN